jgi:TRAP-type mannitol/chloroaromatic compound transport system permease small subunit
LALDFLSQNQPKLSFLLGQSSCHARLTIENWKIKEIIFPSFFTLVLEGIPSSSMG